MVKSSEKLLLKEVTHASRQIKEAARGLAIGAFIRLIRKQLGMSQQVLARLAKVPQSTISHVEKGQRDVNLSTLGKILEALSCDLVVVPVLRSSIEEIRKKQARCVAEKQIRYLQGTMSLEDQKPDLKFLEELLKEEIELLLNGSSTKLWSDVS